ncbi:SPASM domain-containing protein [Pontiellaceae bacterium B1224]|nr:SPASM domain-containing protein [Pontiellaceae bacterium B1224]
MSKRFKKVYCEISGACNLTCNFCPLTDQPRGMMSRELFCKIAAEAAPLAERFYLHLMGEPLLHPDFDFIIDECARHGLPVHLVTNGTLIGPALEPVLLNSTIREINFSLQSFAACYGEEADDTEYLETIFGFIDRALEKRADLQLNLRLWNLDDFASVVDHNRVLLNRIYAHFGEEIPAFSSVGRSHHSCSVPIKGRLFMNYSSRFVWPDMELKECRTHGFCMGAMGQVGIHCDGTVVPCCLDNNATMALGNMNTATLREIFNQPRAQKMMDGFNRAMIVEPLCRRCEFAKRFRKKVKQGSWPDPD